MQKTRLGLVATMVCLAMSTGGRATETARTPHLIYLHGRIVQEQQDPRPEHPVFGFYELEEILDTFRDRGFDVSGEIRAKAATMSESADQVVDQVQSLLESGVTADEVMIVGASAGAGIALMASARLQEPDLRLAVLGTCPSEYVPRIRSQEGEGPSGRMLSIREASDSVTSSCPSWEADTESSSQLRGREIVLETGLGHGFLYRPLPEWVNPVADWARVESGP